MKNDRTASPGSLAPVIVGVRFCGGCNPRFDRSALYKRLAREAAKENVNLEFWEEGNCYSLQLLVNGCPSECLLGELDETNGLHETSGLDEMGESAERGDAVKVGNEASAHTFLLINSLNHEEALELLLDTARRLRSGPGTETINQQL